MKIIEQIDQMRKAKGMNKQTLCNFANINPNSYSNYLSGKSSATTNVIERLCKALDSKLIVLDKKLCNI